MNDDLLLSDDLMPNEGEVFAVAQVEDDLEESTEKAMVVGSYPVFDEIFSWFDTEIEFANDIYKLDLESKVPVESQILARKEVKTWLMSSKSRLEVLRDAHIKR